MVSLEDIWVETRPMPEWNEIGGGLECTEMFYYGVNVAWRAKRKNHVQVLVPGAEPSIMIDPFG